MIRKRGGHGALERCTSRQDTLLIICHLLKFIRANQWQNIKNMLTARTGCGMAVIGGKIIVGGGSNGDILGSTEWYNEETDSWTNGPKMQRERRSFGLTTVRVKKSLNL